MKIIKFLLMMLLVLITTISGFAQDPGIGLSTINSGNVYVGGTAVVTLRINNLRGQTASAYALPAFKLRPQVLLPVDLANVKWAAVQNMLPAGVTICTGTAENILRLSVGVTIPISGALDIPLIVEGVSPGTSLSATGVLQFSSGGTLTSGTEANRCANGSLPGNVVNSADGSVALLNVLAAPLCNLTATAAAPALACGQTNTTLTVTPSGANGAVEYSLDGGPYQDANTFSVPAGGPYVVTVREKALPTCTTTTTGVTVDPAPAATTWYEDQDNDGFGSGNTVMDCTQPAGYRPLGELTGSDDCDDDNAMVWRNVLLYVDNDGDGFTVGDQQTFCIGMNIPAGFVETSAGPDCNDNNDMVWRNVLLFVDSDGDGFTLGAAQEECIGMNIPAGFVETSNGPDCNDNNDMVWRNVLLFVDADGDGFTLGAAQEECIGMNIPAGFKETSLGADCDDNNAGINPAAMEICGNGIDENCNGNADDVCGGTTTWYRDNDGDGRGRPNNPIVSATQPIGYVNQLGDCNDNDPTIYLGAPELPDGKDNNCDGQVDEGLNCPIWYRDVDGDGKGHTKNPRVSCVQPLGYVSNTDDCNDRDATIYLGAPELCDGKDNDCDGIKDEGCEITVTGNESTKPASKVDVLDTENLEARIWPNPARTDLTVSLDAFVPNQKLEITMMQVDGKVQQTQSIIPSVKGQQVKINVSRSAAGFYLLQLKQNGKSVTKRFVIVK